MGDTLDILTLQFGIVYEMRYREDKEIQTQSDQMYQRYCAIHTIGSIDRIAQVASFWKLKPQWSEWAQELVRFLKLVQYPFLVNAYVQMKDGLFKELVQEVG